MSRPAYALLLALLLLLGFSSAITIVRVMDIYRTQQTDNQTIATLRAQVTELKTDLHDTEVALDKAALEGSRLGEQNEVLRYELDGAKRKTHL